MGLARWPRHESRIDQTYHSLERPSGDAVGIFHYLWNAVRRTGDNGVINVAVAVYESLCTRGFPALRRGIRQFRRDHPDPPAALPGHRDAPDVESNLRGRLRPAGRSPHPAGLGFREGSRAGTATLCHQLGNFLGKFWWGQG
jgi:hypothetical protein